MVKTNTVNIISSLNQFVRLYVDKELFIDQTLPFENNRLDLTYISTADKNKIRVKSKGKVYSFEVSDKEIIHLDLNK